MKIGKIFDELLLTEDFKSQRAKFISQGYSEDIVDRYINDFKEIRDKKYKEAKEKELPNLNVPVGEARFNIDNYKTFKELEVLVDYVAGQRKFGSANFEDIKIDGKPIFKNKDVEIFYADTPRACIQYKGNKPYGWCVSRSDSSNMFYNYRLQQHEPAFYFVKRIAATDKEFSFWNLAKDVFLGKFQDKYHFFVIQAIKNVKIGDENTKSYVVTSAMNDGDIQMSWSEIIKIAPELRGLQKIFEPKPLSPEEREKVDKYKKGLSDEDFARLPYKEKEYYMAIYVKMDKPLTDNQFAELPEDLKNKYVGFGVGLSDNQFELIRNNSKLVKRYVEITKRKWEEFVKSNDKDAFGFTSSEIDIVSNDYDLINKLDSDGIYHLLRNSENPKKIVDILNKKGLEFSLPDISYIYSSPSPLKFAELYGLEKVNNFFERYKKYWGSIVRGDNYNRIKNKNEFAKLLILLNKYFNMYISDLLYFFEEDLTYDTIKFYIDTLDNVRDFQMLAISIGKKPDSKEKYEAFESIIKAKNGKFTTEEIFTSLNPKVFSGVDFTKKALLNNGVSKDLINQAIEKYKIQTDLIPENYKLRNRWENLLLNKKA